MDVDLHYREQGTGEPLILLHGNGEDGSYFEHQMNAFASRFRVIALDTRGHGRSPRGEAPSPSASSPTTCWRSWTGKASSARICWDSRTEGISRSRSLSHIPSAWASSC